MKKTLDEYKEFAMKGNVIDLAIGVVIGSAFTDRVGEDSPNNSPTQCNRYGWNGLYATH